MSRWSRVHDWSWLILTTALGVVGAIVALPRASARVAQAQSTYTLPHLVSAGHTQSLAGAHLWRAPVAGERSGAGTDRAQGMVSFGESTVEWQNRAASPSRIHTLLRSTSFFDDVTAYRELRSGGSGTVELRREKGITFSNYVGLIRSETPLGVLARTRWDSGAEVVYEAPEPSTSLILPLAARDVYSHTSILYLVNTDEARESAIQIELFDDAGGLWDAWTFRLGPGESGPIDLGAQAEFDRLPQNAATGFLGALRLTSDTPLAVMAYGDEPFGCGTAALVARPISAASAEQYLPLVRTGPGGHALIAVASASTTPVTVTVTYRAAPTSPSGAGGTIEQTFALAARSYVMVDLNARLQRGSVRPPVLGGSAGFLGSATLRANGNILAAVLEQQVDPGPLITPTVLASLAYNAFGPGELSDGFAVPQARWSAQGPTTSVAVMNPGDTTTTVYVDLFAADGRLMGSLAPRTVVGGEMALIPVTQAQAGSAQAVVRADVPVAVLAVEEGGAGDRTAYRAVKVGRDLVVEPTRGPSPTFPPTWTPTVTPSVTPTLTPTGTATRTATRSIGPSLTPERPGWRSIHLPVAYRYQ